MHIIYYFSADKSNGKVNKVKDFFRGPFGLTRAHTHTYTHSAMRYLSVGCVLISHIKAAPELVSSCLYKDIQSRNNPLHSASLFFFFWWIVQL